MYSDLNEQSCVLEYILVACGNAAIIADISMDVSFLTCAIVRAKKNK